MNVPGDGPTQIFSFLGIEWYSLFLMSIFVIFFLLRMLFLTSPKHYLECLIFYMDGPSVDVAQFCSFHYII